MKKQLKIFGFIYLAFLLITTISCGGDDCGPFPDKYNITSFNWNVSDVEFAEDFYSNNNITNNEVNYSNYGIVVKAKTEEYYSKIFNLNLTAKAYACSPVPPTTDDKITNIEVIINQNYSSTFLSGSNMAEKFKAGFINEQETFESMSLVDYINTNPKVSREFILLLNDAPLENGEYTFTVKITMEGKTLDYFEFTTNSITITNN